MVTSGGSLPAAVALISHAVMREWSLVDFVPKALAFERADPATITESTARRWTAICAPESILLTGPRRYLHWPKSNSSLLLLKAICPR